MGKADVRGVENNCTLGSGEGGRENEGEGSSDESHCWVCGCVCCVEEGEGRATTDEGETNFGRQTNNKQQVSYTGENVLALHYKFS